MVRRLNMQGDAQGDLAGHRGELGAETERAGFAAYATMATPIGKVKTIQKIQMSAVKSNGRLMAANASRHSLRMKTNQATPQTRL